MKKRLFKIILGLTLTFGIAMMFTGLCYLNVVASEGGEIVETLGEGEEETTTTTTDEATEQPSEDEVEENEEEEQSALTEEDRGKIETLIEYLKSIDKDELMDVLNTAKSWLIAGGITTILAFLGAVIGLIASMLKLSREKTKNSNLSEENKAKVLELITNFEKKLVDGNNQIKALLLEFVNNMSDEDKKAMEANVNDVRAKIEQALATTEEE